MHIAPKKPENIEKRDISFTSLSLGFNLDPVAGGAQRSRMSRKCTFLMMIHTMALRKANQMKWMSISKQNDQYLDLS
jgi:hypothetical protein